MKLTKQQIIDIADNLDCGNKSYLHLTTGKIISIIDIESWEDAAEDFEEEARQEIENNSDDYFEFERMPSYTSFSIMEDFTQTIDNTSLQEKLNNVLYQLQSQITDINSFFYVLSLLKNRTIAKAILRFFA